MEVLEHFGEKKPGTLRAAKRWADALEKAALRWAPKFEPEDRDFDPNWLGTGVAVLHRPFSPRDDDKWTAVAILETSKVRDLHSYASFWRRADAYMKAQGASFAALVVGPVEIAERALIGGLVRVPGGHGGTLGGTISLGGRGVGLTAGHVVSSGTVGGSAEQLIAERSGAAVEIGRVLGWSPLERRGNTADLGLIELHTELEGGDRSTLAPVAPETLTAVRKTGASTGVTVGGVTIFGTRGIGVLHNGRRKFFDGLFGIEADGGRFADFGDSGSLVYQEDDATGAVGMVVAVSRSRKGSNQPVCWAVGSKAMSSSIGNISRGGSRTKA